MFRQYSNAQARWLTPDPADLAAVDRSNPQSWNRYAYVLNSPLKWRDPRGTKPVMYVCGGGNDPYQRNGCIPWGYSGTGGAGGGGLIMGNDMFDAIAGEPGTYLSLDMFGNLSFGFSGNLWSMTQNFLDANPFLRGSSALQVVVQDLGTDQLTSGLVPEYLSIMAERAQTVAAMPSRFAQDMAVQYDQNIAQGMSPTTASGNALGYEINIMVTWFSSDPDAQNWLSMWAGYQWGLSAFNNRWSAAFPQRP